MYEKCYSNNFHFHSNFSFKIFIKIQLIHFSLFLYGQIFYSKNTIFYYFIKLFFLAFFFILPLNVEYSLLYFQKSYLNRLITFFIIMFLITYQYFVLFNNIFLKKISFFYWIFSTDRPIDTRYRQGQGQACRYRYSIPIGYPIPGTDGDRHRCIDIDTDRLPDTRYRYEQG